MIINVIRISIIIQRKNNILNNNIRLMITPDPIDISIVDDEIVKKLQEKQKRLDRVMELIQKNGLDKDKEFMEEMDKLIEALIEEKES